MPRYDDEAAAVSERTSLLPKDEGLDNSTVKPAKGWTLWLGIVPVCCLFAITGVPYMTYSLFKIRIAEVLGLSGAESASILGFGMIGGRCFSFVPGLVYDRFGFTATFIIGGMLASSGGFMWYLLLQGTEGVGWLSLALGYFLLSIGARFQQFTGMCTMLNTFPAHVANTVSTFMSLCTSFAFIVLPQVWKGAFMDPDAVDLIPVASFHGFLACWYLANTVAGLLVCRLVPSEHTLGAEKPEEFSTARCALKLMRPHSLALISMITFSLSSTYVYLTSAVATAGKRTFAGSSQAEGAVALIISNSQLVGFGGRCILGFGADLLGSIPGIGPKAGPYLALWLATLMTLLGFVPLAIDYLHEGASETGTLCLASYAEAFAFGGYFAMFPARVRIAFGKKQLGLYLGLLSCYLGVCNYIYDLLGESLHYNSTAWLFASVGGTVNLVAFAFAAWFSLGKQLDED